MELATLPIPQIRLIAQCDNSLLLPQRPPHSLIGVAINGLWLRPQHLPAEMPQISCVVDYSIRPDSDFYARQWVQILRAAFPELNWIELWQISSQAQELARIPIDTLFEGYAFKIPHLLLRQCFLHLSPDALAWLIQKKVGAQELAPLLSHRPEEEFWMSLLRLSLSRQDGIKALELWIELRLLGCELQSLVPRPCEAAAAWLERLKVLRFPRTHLRDTAAQSWINEKNWPKGLHLRWSRQGDQSGLELKFVLRRPQDLEAAKKSFAVLAEEINQAPESLWPKN